MALYSGFSSLSVAGPSSGRNLRLGCDVQDVIAGYESSSDALIANRAVSRRAFTEVDNTLATATIYRLMDHGEALLIRGDKYGMKSRRSE